MRVIVVDDRALIRSGIRALLESMPGISVVAVAGSGLEAIQLATEHHPDVVLMDIGMPGMNGLEATVQIRQKLPEVRVIMVSMHANEEYVRQALRAGAAGYVIKDSSPLELRGAMDAVMRGETFLSPSISEKFDPYLLRIDEPSPLERLTPRQREVLRLIAEGHSNRETARILGISIKTVDAHRTNLMDALDIHDVVQLVRFAILVGLVRVS